MNEMRNIKNVTYDKMGTNLVCFESYLEMFI